MDDKEVLKEIERRLAEEDIPMSALTPEELQDAMKDTRSELEAKRDGYFLLDGFWSVQFLEIKFRVALSSILNTEAARRENPLTT